MKKSVMRRIFSACLICLLVCAFSLPVWANTVFSQSEKLLQAVMDFFTKISRIGLFIGVGWGVLMRQFAGGDHQSVSRAESIIKGSIVAWAVFEGLALIANTLAPYLDKVAS